MVDPAALIASGHALETRAGDPIRDAVDEIVPGLVVRPGSIEAVAATLQWAAANQLSAVLRGQGSKIGWGARPGPVDVLIDLSGLNRVLSHRAGDLTVTVEAGIRLSDLNRQLAPHGQWLALDPPFADRATIGGLLATNDSGPRRHRFGTPRDLVIGIQLATADGALSKAGGQVVKNVAGYDLSKIVSGSFGALAAIVSATFKLTPLPGASASLAIDRLDAATLVGLVDAISASQLEPVAFDLAVQQPAGRPAPPEIACLIRFASFPSVVDAEVASGSALVARFHQSFRTLSGDGEQGLWAAHQQAPWDGPGMVLRAAWRPADLARVLDALTEAAGGCGFALAGRLGVGAGHLRLEGAIDAQRAAVERLRQSGVFGNVVVVRAPASLRTREFVWGPIANQGLVAALKRELDPAGVLGAGRGPV